MTTKTITRSFTAERAADGFVVLSTDTPCPQDGLILAPNGWDLSRWDKVPPKMFYNHSTWGAADYPVGRWEDVQVKDGRLVGKPVFAADEDPERAGVVAKLWDGGFLDDVSVSFKVTAKSLTGPVQADGRDYMISTAHELLECSIVGIGADPNAGKGRIAEAVSRGIITETEAGDIMPAATTDPHAEVNALRAELAAEKAARVVAEEDRDRLQSEKNARPKPETVRVIASQIAHPPGIVVNLDQVRGMVSRSVTADIRSAIDRVMRRLTGRLPD